MKQVVGFAAAAVVVFGLSALGLLTALGAHPNWTYTVPLLGQIPGGLLYAFGLRDRRTGLIVSLVAIILCVIAARIGASLFINSYAENTLAGRFWYFGWIGAVGADMAFLGLLFQRAVNRT